MVMSVPLSQAESSSEGRRKRLEDSLKVWKPATLSQHFDAIAARYPDRPLVISDHQTFTYGQMTAWSRRIASGLIASGVRSGSQVALILGNFPEFVAVKLAIARVGATAVPINFLLRRSELRYILEQSDSVALITMSAFRDIDYLQELDAIAPGWEHRGGGAQLPKLRSVFVLPTSAGTRAHVRTLEDLAGLGTTASQHELARREAADLPESRCDIIYTSGTTGRSKGVILTHQMVLRTAYASAYTRAFEDGRRILFALPMYHVFGYVECLVASTFVAGAIVPQAVFDAEQMLDAWEHHHATEIVCVPTMTVKLIEIARERASAPTHLVSFFNSGGATAPEIWGQIRRYFAPREIFTAYGMTETTASTTCTQPGDSEARLLTTNGCLKPAGLAADPQLRGVLALYKAVDPESGQDMPSGIRGELMVRGPIVTPGYYNKPEETAAAFSNGWLHTGDVGTVAQDGYVTLLGRIKESYRCGGEMVMPLEIEELVNQHPLVAQALVVGVPDPKMGEVGCLCIVPRNSARPEPDELINLCAQRLARFKVPRHVLFITPEEIPTTVTGRPQKFKLAELVRQRLRAPSEQPAQ
jgi:fatty-acyl-CoA synthase